MIRIEITPTDRVGNYSVLVRGEGTGAQLRIEQTRFPLIDTCRKLKRMGVDPLTRVGIFRNGVEEPALTSTVGRAAELRVREGETTEPKFEKFRPYGGIQEDAA